VVVVVVVVELIVRRRLKGDLFLWGLRYCVGVVDF